MAERKTTYCMTMYGFRYEYTKAGALADRGPKWLTTANDTAKDEKAVAGALLGLSHTNADAAMSFTAEEKVQRALREGSKWTTMVYQRKGS